MDDASEIADVDDPVRDRGRGLADPFLGRLVLPPDLPVGKADGVQLARLADRQRLYAGRVERTQDYVVSVVPADEGARYELTVTLR